MKNTDDMLWLDWTGHVHTYLFHIRLGIWVIAGLELARIFL